MAERLYVVSLMRPFGDTGLQAHVNSFLDFLHARSVSVERVTPYGRGMWFFYPLFALRFVLQQFHLASSVRWYRHVRLLALTYRLRRLLADGHPAVLYAQCPVSAAACLRARRGSAQRVVMVVHFNVSQADEWAWRGYFQIGDRTWRSIRAFEAAVLPRVDALVFVSRYVRDRVLDEIPSARAVPHQVVPNFVSLPHAAADRPMRGPGEIALVSVGTLEPRKNQQYLLEILSIARRICPGLTLTLIGDGPDRDKLERHAQDLRLQSSVCFLGKVDQASDLLHRFDAYIHAARMESFGIVLIEAMAHGLPVFACPVGGVPDVFTNGREGVYLPLDSPHAAAQLLTEALQATHRCEQMGRAGRARFRREYADSVAGPILLDFLLATAGTAGIMNRPGNAHELVS
jgi:glycosyltransferase involved in cell wall biosynthesis